MVDLYQWSQLFYGGPCAVITEILQWPYGHLRSCRNVAVAIQGHHIANLNLFPAADVAIELLSGIKMLSISMVASKMFMPQKKIKSPKKGNGYRLYYQLQLFYDGLCTIVTEILQRTYGHRGYSKNSGVAMQVHRTGNPNFFLAAEVAIELLSEIYMLLVSMVSLKILMSPFF